MYKGLNNLTTEYMTMMTSMFKYVVDIHQRLDLQQGKVNIYKEFSPELEHLQFCLLWSHIVEHCWF